MITKQDPTPRMNYDSLKKGDVVSQLEIERIYNIRHAKEPEMYRLKLLDLRDEIHHNRHDLYVRCDGLTLLVMTDAEAQEHRVSQTVQSIRRLTRLSDYGARIDASKLTAQQAKALEHQDSFLAMQSLALRRQHAKMNREIRLLGCSNPESEDNEPE